MLDSVRDLVVQFEICNNPMVTGPGTEFIWGIRGFDEGVKPIVQNITDAGIPIVPVQMWFESTTRRDGWHPDQQQETLAKTANVIASVATIVDNIGGLRQLRTEHMCSAVNDIGTSTPTSSNVSKQWVTRREIGAIILGLRPVKHIAESTIQPLGHAQNRQIQHCSAIESAGSRSVK